MCGTPSRHLIRRLREHCRTARNESTGFFRHRKSRSLIVADAPAGMKVVLKV
jgi:hypothetical protein